jgi:hypothetical protein
MMLGIKRRECASLQVVDMSQWLHKFRGVAPVTNRLDAKGHSNRQSVQENK